MDDATTPGRAGASAAGAREAVHSRSLTYRGFRRADGLWDFEAVLEDRKHHDFETLERVVVPAGQPYHRMLVTLVVDDALKVLDVATTMDVTPFAECQGATDPMRRLVGATLGRGWRRTVIAALGGTSGCTHVRELLYNLATAALQTVPAYHLRGRPRDEGLATAFPGKPGFVDDCRAWRADGPVVLRHFPRHARPEPPASA